MEEPYLLDCSKKIEWTDDEISEIEPIRGDNYDQYIVFKKIYQALTETKNRISKVQEEYNENEKQNFQTVVGKDIEKNGIVNNWKDWNGVKKLTNLYELIHIPSRNFNDSVAYYLPVSRSYFKMVEILNEFDLFGNYQEKDITVTCLAEGPGGFIEAIIKHRKDKFDRVFGFTLKSNNRNIPNWRKMHYSLGKLNRNGRLNPNVDLQYGDIYQEQDIMKFMERVKSVSTIITADGGFDYTSSFNYQEQVSYRLIFSEIIAALHLQAPGGHFICKVFDLFSLFSIKMIYLVHCFYDEVYLYKPKTSRPANSEKYLVAKGFKGIKPKWLSKLRKIQRTWIKGEYSTIDLKGIKLPNDFTQAIYKFNMDFVEMQNDNINQTLHLINHPPSKQNYNKIIQKQVENALEWCKKYNENINYKSKYKEYYNSLLSDVFDENIDDKNNMGEDN